MVGDVVACVIPEMFSGLKTHVKEDPLPMGGGREKEEEDGYDLRQGQCGWLT